MVNSSESPPLPHQNGPRDHNVQTHDEDTSIKSVHGTDGNVKSQNKYKEPVIRPIIQETSDRINTLIALAKTAGPNDEKTKSAKEALMETINTWEADDHLDKGF
ncbi:hypothetical protein FLONG3_11430 [Fusarium longipes]|uniref:Uncharacterized protein n=1 Tax=Fusarium longipes TaxID=694270 RepID=A0A395RFC9_9HYPO|nr:hypothetical protein FLONG3_11430 [Fusarium longipes]